MTTVSPVHDKPPKRRWLLYTGLVLLQLLLMGSAFVGGRMLAAQNQRGVRGAGAFQLPSQLPKEPAAGSGTVQSIQGAVVTLGGRGFGGPQGGGQQSATATEVAFTADTKFYMNTSTGGIGSPGGGQAQITVADATSADVKVGSNVTVWGTKNGARITAELVYIQSTGR